MHLIKWQVVLNDKEGGGLGIRNLKAHNKSLLFKWLWRFTQEGDKVWKKLISAIYGIKTDWRPSSLHLNAKGGIWKINIEDCSTRKSPIIARGRTGGEGLL